MGSHMFTSPHIALLGQGKYLLQWYHLEKGTHINMQTLSELDSGCGFGSYLELVKT